MRIDELINGSSWGKNRIMKSDSDGNLPDGRHISDLTDNPHVTHVIIDETCNRMWEIVDVDANGEPITPTL